MTALCPNDCDDELIKKSEGWQCEHCNTQYRKEEVNWGKNLETGNIDTLDANKSLPKANPLTNSAANSAAHQYENEDDTMTKTTLINKSIICPTCKKDDKLENKIISGKSYTRCNRCMEYVTKPDIPKYSNEQFVSDFEKSEAQKEYFCKMCNSKEGLDLLKSSDDIIANCKCGNK